MNIEAKRALMYSAEISIIFLSLFWCFSKKSKEQIINRDHHRCVMCGSVLNLECAHISHDKRRADYDDPKNGRLLCVNCHYLDHVNRAGRNGLSKEANDWAINKIKKRL